MNVLKKMQDVGLCVEDPVLQARIYSAALKVALDAQSPHIEPISGVGDEPSKDPVTVLTESKDKLTEYLHSLPPKDPALSAALGIASSIESVLRHIDNLVQGIGEDEDLAPLRAALENVRGDVSKLSGLGLEFRTVAETIVPENAPVFPKLPSTVLPDPSADADQLPVIVDEEEDVVDEPEESEYTEESEETEEEVEEEAPRSIDEILNELEGGEEDE